jgi:hypothetical protein
VLSRVAGEAREVLAEATSLAADATELFIAAPIEELMKRYNAAPKKDEAAPDDPGSAG